MDGQTTLIIPHVTTDSDNTNPDNECPKTFKNEPMLSRGKVTELYGNPDEILSAISSRSSETLVKIFNRCLQE